VRKKKKCTSTSFMSFKLNVIQKEYGDIETFRSQAKRWIQSLPEEYFESNKDIKMVRDKNVDWNDAVILRIVHRKMASLEHVEWINSVVERIEKMEEEVENASLPPVSTRVDREEEMRKKFQEQKESALDFIDDVKDYALRNLKVTERQLEALNRTYKKFEQLI